MRILITGGAGMVGSHAAEYYATRGEEVVVLDNLMRSKLFGYDKKSVEFNWNYLAKYKNVLRLKGDVREKTDVLKAIGKGVDLCIHAAGQPGVGLSCKEPLEDFSINAFGTLNVLEALRQKSKDTSLAYCSTNKVFGENVDKIKLIEMDKRYAYDGVTGVAEDMPIDLTGHTPYGASKYTGDIYVQEYARIYGMRTAVFRMSCLSKDTEISTPEGNIEISKINKKNIPVYAFDKNLKMYVKKTKGSFRTSGKTKKLCNVKTGAGYFIKATDDHRFFTPAGYVPLRNIAYGSLIAVCPQAYYQKNGHVSRLPKKAILTEEIFMKRLQKYKRKNESNLKYVKKLSKENLLPLLYNNKHIYLISRLVGYLTGDAHLYHRIKMGGKSYTEIQVYALSNEIEDIKGAFRVLGFLPGKTRASYAKSILSTGQIIKGTTYKFSITTTDAFAFFEQLGVPVGNKSKLKHEVPEWIRRGPRDIKIEYLRGIFGAELSAPYLHCRENSVKSELQPLQFSQSKNEELSGNAKRFRGQIVKMLNDEGIETRVHECRFLYKKGGDKSICFYILIKPSKENFFKFAKIGYGFNRERNLKLYRIVEFMKTGLQYKYYKKWEKEYAHNLGESGLLWDRLINKKRIPMGKIYDITVPVHHNFLANGFLVHNCIYGIRQFGFEDQGWVAHFVISNLLKRAVTIFGNGKQVRDVLYVEDLIGAYDKFFRSDVKSGVYNIGGGRNNTISLLEFMEMIESQTGIPMNYGFSDWRPSDQKVYISNISKVSKELGWQPKISPEYGVRLLVDWVKNNMEAFK